MAIRLDIRLEQDPVQTEGILRKNAEAVLAFRSFQYVINCFIIHARTQTTDWRTMLENLNTDSVLIVSREDKSWNVSIVYYHILIYKGQLGVDKKGHRILR